MPDPDDLPDLGPVDDLQRQTERIIRALGERAQARSERNLAGELSVERRVGERAERDAERRRADLDQRSQPAVGPPDTATEPTDRAGRGSGPTRSAPDEQSGARHLADDAGERSGRAAADADRHDQLAARLEAHRIDPALAQTRIRAGRSFGAPATMIKGQRASAVNPGSGVQPDRTRGAAARNGRVGRGGPVRRPVDRGRR